MMRIRFFYQLPFFVQLALVIFGTAFAVLMGAWALIWLAQLLPWPAFVARLA